jgi:hypothetical protein
LFEGGQVHGVYFNRFESDFPNIYVSGASFEQWSGGASVNLTLRNPEPAEYLLTAIEIEEMSTEPFKSLLATANTKGIVINGITQIFKEANPLVKMTVQRGSKTYRLELKILTIRGADERNHFQGFAEQSIPAAVLRP